MLATCQKELPRLDVCSGAKVKPLTKLVWAITADKACFSALREHCVIEENKIQSFFNLKPHR